jgi:hypothetical protein
LRNLPGEGGRASGETVLWVIIVIVLIAAFGPILYVMPTRRDRRLARVRARAREVGFVVELYPVRQTNPTAQARVSAGGVLRNPTQPSVAYLLPFGARLEAVPAWFLLRDEKAGPPVPGWNVEQGDASSIVELGGLLDDLMDDVIGVELKVRSLTCYWLESAPADAAEVDQLKAVMVRMRERIVALDRARMPPEDDPVES